VDPLADQEGQESWTPYHYGFNDPVRYNDPDGEVPILGTAVAGAIGGAAFEYGSQVIGNLFSGKSIKESLTDVDVGKIGTAAITGAIAGAGGGLIAKGALKVASKLLNKADDGGRYVYRALAKTDDVSKGLKARSAGTQTKPISHVAGKKRSERISTTKDKAVATQKYNKEGNGVVRIDLKKVKTEVRDISGGFEKGGRFSNYAKKDAEVLIKDNIPANAIKWVVKPNKPN
jgi:hypothetical protein